MERFTELEEHFQPGLELTVKGRQYVVPLASAELGLWCRLIAKITGQITAASTDGEMRAAAEGIESLPSLPGDSGETLAQRTLGAAYGQMTADRVPDPYIEYCGITAYMWIVGGEEAARRWWYSGGNPESAARGNRAERRTGGNSTAGAAKTNRAGYTSGTNSRRRSRGNGRGTGSRGTRS